MIRVSLYRFFIIFVIGVLLNIGLFSQKSVELKKDQAKIKKDIELIENLINETKKKKDESFSELNLIERKIETRNNFIISINEEVREIDKLIIENILLIESLEIDLKQIKKEYSVLIYNSYVNRRKENLLLYVFASQSFNQAYKRIKYMQLYSQYKSRQSELIIAFEKVIVNKNKELLVQRSLKESLRKEREAEMNSITKEKERKRRLVISLQDKERELLKEIEEKRKLAKNLEKEIAKVIENERKKGGVKNLYEMLTPEEKLISNNFESNKGKLPWPTNQGIITGKFGVQDHPVLRNVKIRNDGIYISTVDNSDVRSVFNGIVSKIFSLPGSNFAIIIKHGNYFTLYNNLSEVIVKEGDKISTKQRIGRVFSDNEKNENVLHFQVWKEMEKNDPEVWLSK